jgi:Domain of unknown function (DUF4376)
MSEQASYLAKYDPYHWFWLADDGRIYSSEKQMLVTADDPLYAAFIAGHPPTPWPRDDQDNQTDASLQAVLQPYGTLFANDIYYAADVRDKTMEAGITVTGITTAPAGMPIKTDPAGQREINSQANAALEDQQYTTTWIATDGNFYNLSNDDIHARVGKQFVLFQKSCNQAYINAVNGVRHKQMGRKDIAALFAEARRKANGG